MALETDTALEDKLLSYVDSRRERLIGIIRELVGIPSENMPPGGAEGACQQHIAGVLRKRGWEATLYEMDRVPGLREHPLYWPGRDYRGRPNLGARKKGSGGGRSVVLSGHIDTVPVGSAPWAHPPFGGAVEGNLLYGRGSNDMKGGVGTSLFVTEALEDLGLRLRGDLVFETVIDEEFGGVNGTLAGRLMGFNGDAAIITEPSFLRVLAGQRGGRTVHLTFTVPPSGGILTQGKFPAGVIDQLSYFLKELPRFAGQRRANARPHELYENAADPVPVAITKIHTGPWGTREPIAAPEVCKVEMYWQLMPGETQEEVDREFFAWMDSLRSTEPHLFAAPPEVVFPIRYMPGSAISKREPLVTELAACAERALGQAPPVAGIEGPCDMYVFHQAFGIPAVLWGPRGGNTHTPDEYLEIDSAVAAAKALLLFVCRWCGLAN